MIDSIKIKIKAGNGGNGLVSFQREALFPRGGPSGGHGGNGGDVIFYGDKSVNTLLHFENRRKISAGDGSNGGSKNRTGKSADNIRVGVPVGTEIWSVDQEQRSELLGDLIHDGQSLVLAKGGRGGLGNTHFVTSTNKEPLLAEAGAYGEEKYLQLELKLLADVGVIGMPNAGKSSILLAVSKAQPKIADYAFTTLSPNLGVVEHELDVFVVVDIPGLIEGAHRGVGLGHKFLKHIERTRMLVHVIDGSEVDFDVRLKIVNEELLAFNPRLSKVKQMVIVNKIDLVKDEKRKNEIKKRINSLLDDETKLLFVSASTGQGIDCLISEVSLCLDGLDSSGPTHLTNQEVGHIIRPLTKETKRDVIKIQDSVYRILHPKLLQLAKGSDLKNWQVLIQFYAKLSDYGVSKSLKRQGIRSGDSVLIEDWEFEWE